MWKFFSSDLFICISCSRLIGEENTDKIISRAHIQNNLIHQLYCKSKVQNKTKQKRKKKIKFLNIKIHQVTTHNNFINWFRLQKKDGNLHSIELLKIHFQLCFFRIIFQWRFFSSLEMHLPNFLPPKICRRWMIREENKKKKIRGVVYFFGMMKWIVGRVSYQIQIS